MAGGQWADFLKHDGLGHTFRRLARVGFYLHLIRAALNRTLHVAARNRHRRSDFGVGSRFGPLALESVSGVAQNCEQPSIGLCMSLFPTVTDLVILGSDPNSARFRMRRSAVSHRIGLRPQYHGLVVTALLCS